MLKIHIVGSGSTGNGYILETSNSAITLECGVKFNAVLQSIDFNISKIVGGVCSHIHGDHAKYIHEYLKNGIPILNNVYENFRSINISHREKVTICDWTIIPLKMVHDVDCFGFIISHPECGNVFFATDTEDIPYELEGINYAVIESNFSQSVLDNKCLDKKINGFLAERIEKSHLSFEKCRQWLFNCDKSKLESVVLIHLSDGNSQARKYVTELQEELGIPIYTPNNKDLINLKF